MVSFRNIKPIVPATIKVTKIGIFELFTMSALSNARSVMKIDIVNAIPYKKPIPIIYFYFNSVGNRQTPKQIQINEMSQMT